MEKILSGIQAFQSDTFAEEKDLFEKLAGGQSPQVLFITCSDSRIDPNLITHTKPGDLFVLRTAGNIIPPYGAVRGGEAATVEYAVDALSIPDIVVCGHSHCGAMSGLLDPPEGDSLPAVKELLSHAIGTKRLVDQMHPAHDDAKARLNIAIEQNVIAQLDNLRTHPSVAAALARGDVRLHGCVYEFETGDIRRFDTKHNQFVGLHQPPEDVMIA